MNDSAEHRTVPPPPGASPPISPALYREELFKVVCGSLVDIHKSFQNLARDLVVFSLLVIGWLITSRFSRGFVRGHVHILYPCLAMVALIFSMYSLEVLRLVRISRRKIQQLDEIGYTDRSHYRNYRVTFQMAMAGIVLVCVVFAMLCATLITV